MAWTMRMKTHRFRCPKHRVYNPETKGQAGIKGGCPFCGQMYSAFRAYSELRQAAVEFDKIVAEVKTDT